MGWGHTQEVDTYSPWSAAAGSTSPPHRSSPLGADAPPDTRPGVAPESEPTPPLLRGHHGAAPWLPRAWFQGLNPQLEDRSPARLLREGDLDEGGLPVLSGARSFAATG